MHHRLFSKSLLTALFLGLTLTFSQHSLAGTDSPQALLEKTAAEMIDALNANRDKIKGHPQLTEDLIEKILLPNIDFITASKYVLGNYWNDASKEQKIEFINCLYSILTVGTFPSFGFPFCIDVHRLRAPRFLRTVGGPGCCRGGR